MKTLIFFSFFIYTFFSYSQNLNAELKFAKTELASINFKVDSLNKIKKDLEKKIDSIEIALFDSNSVYIIRWDWKRIKAGEKCKIIKPGNDWTIVSTANIKNYKVPTYFLEKEDKHVERQKKNKKEEEKEKAERKNYLIKQFGSRVANKILDKKIWMGMTEQMAIESWGKPTDINKTVGSWGVHEQWVYREKGYNLYFENGILTAWQD